MNGDDQFLGIVRNGRFEVLQPKSAAGEPARLTRIQMQAGQSPEGQEIALAEYEGSALMVRGHQSGTWIYSAEIIDTAGPILTMVVERVFRGT
jgi:hypothetical protein